MHALADGTPAEKICESSRIDAWFIARLEAIVRAEQELSDRKLSELDAESLLRLKQLGFSDRAIGRRRVPGGDQLPLLDLRRRRA